ncbi:MAG: LysM peptidoglycan-binding domain-containing protein [Vicinamibacterales bacterium]
MIRPSTRYLTILSLLPLVAACGSTVRKAPHTAAVQPSPVPLHEAAPALPQLPNPDAVGTLLAESDRHFEAGRHELDAGHVERARIEFDRALNVLIESPFGGRTEPRIREQFDRLVDRISTYEVKALAEGDGFTEKQYEPASIDELLAMSATLAPSDAEYGTGQPVTSDEGLPIPLNQRVQSFIELFQGRLHDFLQEGMKRGSRYLPMIQNVFRAEGLPLDLAYVPLVESAFKPNALSRAQAKGVWQFVRGTGLENGLRQDWYIDERSDPEKATIAAAKYLNTLSRLFDGDWHLALASYNGGPGRMQRAIKASGLDDFWSLAANPKLLPRETRDYVPMILAAIVIARNPAEYGFEFEPEAPYTFETVTLEKPVDLRRIAEWTDTNVSSIQALNPELRRWTTPIRAQAYALKVPVGTGDVVKAKLVGASPTDLAALRWYTVRKGDTLATVARKLRVNRADLAAANYLSLKSRITVGQQLMVPHETSVLMTARADTSSAAPASARSNDVVRAVAVTGNGGRVKIAYRVRRGDTLGSIARTHNTSIASLKTWNHLRGTRIRAGETLTIYTAQRAN